LIAVDSSVVVAAFASWHELHDRARAWLNRAPRLPAHAALESYSVLTRLPPPHRVGGEPVLAFLAARFPESYLVLDAEQFRDFLRDLRARRITGGAAYDGLIAATASAVGAELVSCDRRAAETYRRLGVPVELLH
jgi:predicted nucleic acid-binding protein